MLSGETTVDYCIKKQKQKIASQQIFYLLSVTDWAVLGKFKRYRFIWNTPFTDNSDWMLIEAVAVACRDNVAEPRLCGRAAHLRPLLHNHKDHSSLPYMKYI